MDIIHNEIDNHIDFNDIPVALPSKGHHRNKPLWTAELKDKRQNPNEAKKEFLEHKGPHSYKIKLQAKYKSIHYTFRKAKQKILPA